MRRRSRYHLRLLALLLALFTLCLAGCTSTNIREDAVQEDLPALDPEAGVAREITVTRYYRLSEEPYLVGVTRTIEVRANERTEYAIVRSLLEGVPALASNVSEVFPANTSLVDVALDGGILYVTLSRDFLSEAELNEARTTLEGFLSRGYYSQAEYQKRLEEAVDAFYLKRSLAIYSLVNTLCAYNEDIRVLPLVDESQTGVGVRVSRATLGIAQSGDAPDSELVEPMGFVQSVVATPYAVIDCLLGHMSRGEYELAYVLFAEDENDEQQKPAYAGFETEMLSLGRLDSYVINGVSPDASGGLIYANVDLQYTRAGGEPVTFRHAQIPMHREGDLYKAGYASYKTILEVR